MTRQTELFAERMRDERRRLGVTQAELADRLYEVLGRVIYRSAVARVETNQRAVRLDEALAIADVLEMPLSALLRDRKVIDDEIDELRRDLDLTEYRASQAQAVVEEAQEAMRSTRRRIAELEAARGD